MTTNFNDKIFWQKLIEFVQIFTHRYFDPCSFQKYKNLYHRPRISEAMMKKQNRSQFGGGRK